MKFPPRFARDPLLDELVGYLSENRVTLQREWRRRAAHDRLLETLAPAAIDAIADALFERYIAALAEGGLAGLRTFLARLPSYLQPRGISGRDALVLAGLLRDVCGRSLFRQFRHYEGRTAESGRTSAERTPRWPSLAPALQPN